jgi:NADH dehydrogenase FAD-containing subunit
VAKVAADGVLLEDGEHVDADLVVWTVGFRAPRRLPVWSALASSARPGSRH